MRISVLVNLSEKFLSVDFIFAAILIIITWIVSLFLFKKAVVRITDSILSLGIISLLMFDLNIAAITLSLILVVFMIIVGFINGGAYRNFIANPSKTVKTMKWFGNKAFEEEEASQEKVLMTVCDAVATLSKTKTGALITFERKDSLEDYIKTGSIINTPITKEIIQTIFYPGTRLHDGAIVIRDNLIISASVYYTPTTKPLSGKYGARHRAAIGISEVTDSITIVVSEETGRISVAANGELVSVALDNIYRVLQDYFDNKE